MVIACVDVNKANSPLPASREEITRLPLHTEAEREERFRYSGPCPVVKSLGNIFDMLDEYAVL
jgi:hypothetical protein